ncbi:hypothetical protein [Sporosarcina sp. YIM B06819]|uniref:SWIM zinc finger family protein n=1 Tax=Sporosarcina sp. YIM B06819 TaxID=3081769 RepID=UPI00298BE4E1|nr:hypothetical protein [Sporosarcina sp. YIM B06819]
MNLQNFEHYIDQKIVDRGHEYYMDGHVMAVGLHDHEYCFQVVGVDKYEVLVTLNNDGDILSSYCDCPYTYGPVCKHEVAVYFELLDMLDDASSESDVMEKGQSGLIEVLNNLSKDQLIDIIDELAGKDKILKSRLMLTYSKETTGQELASFKSWVHSIVSKYKGREGFISYRETNDFASELSECLVQIEACSDAVVALGLAFLLVEEAIEAFQYADDSDGDIGCLVEDTLEVIEMTITNALGSEVGQKQELFEKLLKQCEHPVFEGWEDYQITLLKICTNFADSSKYREALSRKVESLIDENTSQRYQHYRNEALNRLLFEMIDQYGTEEEADQFIQAHLHYSSFREELIQRCIVEGNYNRVIELAAAGERSDMEYSGLVSKWKKFRYEAYKALSLRREQKLLAKDLFMNGDFDFYHELKALAKDSDQFYGQLKQELQKHSGWQSRSLFQSLIEEENDTDELMEFVRAYSECIEQYASDLVGVYKEEVQQVYKEHIEMTANRASNRKDYQGVCRMIRRYENIVGKQLQQAIVNELRSSYRRKPAFVDELSKI